MAHDEYLAERAVRFIQSLRLIEGRWAGKPLRLMPWQEQLVRDVFGTIDEQGHRQYRFAYVEIPKKNGKTPLAAAIALYLLVGDCEPGAQIYCAATERDQAALVFRHAAGMVRSNRALAKRLKVVDSTKTIADHSTGSFLRAISAEANSKHGYNIHGLVFDELHALRDREFWEVLTEGTGDARSQPLTLVITTAGYDRNSVCWEIHEHALKVRDGIIKDDRFYPMVYSLPEDEDWEDPKNWERVNPAIGYILDPERIREHYDAAVATPSRVNAFRRYRLCQWTQAETRFLRMSDWDACGGLLKAEELAGQPCFAGLDLASTTDMAALALLFPRDDGIFRVIMRFWCPEETIVERSKRDHVPYDLWVRQGWVKATPGNVIDYEHIEQDIYRLASRYRIQEIAYDPWGATELIQRLMREGLTMVPVRQGFASLSPPTKELEKLVLARQLNHGGNPVLRWMADNLVVEHDAAGNYKPSKAKSTEKIDGMVALIMAIDRAVRHQPVKSVYETRGILTL